MLGKASKTLVGALLMLAMFEVVLRLLPVSTATKTGYHVDQAILSYPPGHRWQVATGWDLRNAQRLQANNLGFASAKDYTLSAIAVALIGDSFVEASMLDEADRPGPQLERALRSTRPVYALGGPGSSLLDYAERVRFASERLGVRDFVVLMEAGDLRQALCGSGNVHSACLDPQTLKPRTEVQAPASTLKKLARESALAQYLFSQLKFDLGALIDATFSREVPEHPVPVSAPVATASAERSAPMSPSARAVAETFFARVQPYRTGRLVIVLDGARAGHAVRADPDRAHFIAMATANGAQVIDAEPLFAAHASRSARSLQVGPYDAHLNAVGVALLMNAAAEHVR